MEKAGYGPHSSLDSENSAPQGIELRHLRYFVAVAEAGTFTHAAERMYVGQPTLSQQIRRLEEIVGTPLLQRRREGVRLTDAGTVLLEESRAVLSLVDHGVSRTRRAAGLGRSSLRFVVQPQLPPALAAEVVRRLRSAAPEVDVTWLETAPDADFAAILQRRADAALGWTGPADRALPDPLDVMHVGSFEPDVWIPARHPAAAHGVIGLGALARAHVIHGPRNVRRLARGAAGREPVLRLHRPAVPAVAARGPGLRRDREPSQRRPDGAVPPRGNRAAAGGGRGPARDGARSRRGVRADRHRRSGVERGPSAGIAATAFRDRGEDCRLDRHRTRVAESIARTDTRIVRIAFTGTRVSR